MVSEAYCADISDLYTINLEKTGAAIKSLENAVAIVENFSHFDDYNKLLLYDAKIRELVDYNHEAVDNEDTPYGDPWQFIWVFDNDPSTDVVCEGYAKAFQLLCDLSEFEGDIECINVVGEAGEAHMWNIVKMDDGKNYLVDVTWNDSSPGKYFLVGGPGSVSEGYTTAGSSRTYHQQMFDIFGTGDDSILALSETDYVYSPDPNAIVNSGECGDNLTWRIMGDGELIIEGTGDMWVWTDYYFAPWAAYAKFANKLTIKEGITSISYCSFNGFVNLKDELVMPSTVTSIGSYAFSGCQGFTGDLIIPSSVTTIGNYAFQNCRFTGDLIIGDGVTTIGDYSFSYCSKFSGNLIIGNSVTTIGNNAFYRCEGFTGDLIIPDSVLTIGDRAFTECYGFTGDLVIGDGVTTIGEYAFQFCEGFSGNLIIGDSVTTIGEAAFSNCINLTGDLILGNNIVTIEKGAFINCGSPSQVVIPESVKSIGDYAFAGIKSLEKAIIYSKDVVFGAVVFMGNHPDFVIYCYADSTAKTYARRNNYKYVEIRVAIDSGECGDSLTWVLYDNNELVIDGTGDMWNWESWENVPWKNHKESLEILTVKDGVTTIGDYAFYTCYKLKGDFTLPDSVEKIGSWAFGKCTGFTGDLVIPGGVTTIGDYAFFNCFGFTGDLIIGDGVTTIGDYAFSECSGLNGSLIIGKSVSAIGEFAFSQCSGLTGSVVFGESVTSIGANAFRSCYSISEVVIPIVTRKIDDNAFVYCSSLKIVTVYSKDISFGAGVFAASSQDLVIYGYANSTVKEYARNNGHNFVEIEDVPVVSSGNCGDNLTWTLYSDGELVIEGTGDMWDWTSSNNTPWYSNRNYLRKLTINEGVTSIGNYAFSECSNLIGELIIPNSVTVIGEYAFAGCSGFTGELSIIENVTTIGNYAFSGCNGIAKATVYSKNVMFGTSVFVDTNEDFTIHGYPDSTAEAYAKANNHKFISFGTRVVTASGKCGANLIWTLYRDGELVIEGTGNMNNWDDIVSVPWNSYKAVLTKLTIGNEITSIGNYAFYQCTNIVGDLVIPDSVISIGLSAFSGCTGFDGKLVIGNGVQGIGHSAFYGCKGFTGSLTIGNSVTTIDKNAFSGCSGFTGGLIIPDSVTTISSSAFSGCSGFTGELSIGNGVTTIGQYAFSGCSGFTGVLTIGNSVTTIDKNAFSKCRSISEIIVPESVKSINDSAFNTCDSLRKIAIYSKDVTIGSYVFSGAHAEFTIYGYAGSTVEEFATKNRYPFVAFDTRSITASGECGDSLTWTLYDDGELVIEGTGDMWDWANPTDVPWYAYKESLKKLTINEGVTSIGDYAFKDCAGLTGLLVMPSGVTHVGNEAFSGCIGFTGSLTIPESVISIGKYAFYKCSGFTGDLVIPDSVTVISSGAFRECTGFTGGLKISRNITIIDDLTFYGCSGFTGYLTFPNNVTTVGDWAFYGCNGFTGSLLIPVGVTSIGDHAFERCDGFTGNLVMYAGLTTIGEHAFAYCNGFTGNLAIPGSVTTIGEYAFAYCSGFAGTLILPNEIVLIEQYSFSGCSFTGELEIPDSVVSIGNYAFQNCSSIASDLTVPAQVNYIGYGAFTGCTTLMNIFFEGNAPEVVGANEETSSFDSTVTLHYTPTTIGWADSEYYDETSSTWKGYALKVWDRRTVLLSGECGDNLIWTLYDDGELIIDGTGDMWNWESRTSAPWCYYERHIKRLTLKDGVTSIGENAFHGYSGITGALIIPESVTSISNYAFTNCSGFTGNLVLHKGITSIGEYAFRGCSGFTGNLVIPSGITSLGKCVFRECSGFTGSLIIPDGVTIIGMEAFYRCSGIVEVTIPENVVSIDAWAFNSCTSLEKVMIYSRTAVFGAYVFINNAADFEIYGHAGSTAETYASTNGYKFMSLGVTLTGTIISFLSETETITVQLMNGDAEVASTTVTGNTAIYTIEGVEPGTYTLRISKKNHATREYEVIVGDENVVQDAKIHPIGDVTGDGKVSVVDAARANSHAKKVTLLTGYELACADVTGDGKVSVVDAARINSHAKKVTFLW